MLIMTAMTGKTREISLPEDDADVVATYFDWLTTKDVPLFTKIEPSFVRPLPHYALLSKLYTFGEKVQSDAFCDDVLSKICQGLEQVHHDNGEVSTFAFLDKIRFAYEGTPASSPLRRLLVEGFAKGGSVESLDGEHGNPGPEFMMDLAKALLAARDAKEYSWDKNRKKFFKKKPVSSQDLANSLPADTSERTRKRKSGRD